MILRHGTGVNILIYECTVSNHSCDCNLMFAVLVDNYNTAGDVCCVDDTDKTHLHTQLVF